MGKRKDRYALQRTKQVRIGNQSITLSKGSEKHQVLYDLTVETLNHSLKTIDSVENFDELDLIDDLKHVVDQSKYSKSTLAAMRAKGLV